MDDEDDLDEDSCENCGADTYGIGPLCELCEWLEAEEEEAPPAPSDGCYLEYLAATFTGDQAEA